MTPEVLMMLWYYWVTGAVVLTPVASKSGPAVYDPMFTRAL